MKHPWPPGTRVRKINSVPGEDIHSDGAKGAVKDAIGPEPTSGEWGYFVCWDDLGEVTAAGYDEVVFFIGSSRLELDPDNC